MVVYILNKHIHIMAFISFNMFMAYIRNSL